MNSEKGKIAVIGMACRFPGANNIDEYWNNLINGKQSIKHFKDEEIKDFEIDYDQLKINPNFVPARGILEKIDEFDAPFFGMSPNEASLTDPQHRVWLETVWAGFENAGCNPKVYKGSIGVYAGGYANTYLLNNVLRDPKKYENYIRLRKTQSFQIATTNDISHLPTKTAYLFNLKGPAVNVQTACSTSLVAIAQACTSLYSFESDICIAGGICILNPQESGYIYQEGAIPSPDGHCRPFDAKGQGTVFSNGVGVVVLKRIEDAIKDNDHIYAVVDGWALNNDGNKKVSYTAPSVQGQEEVILMAQSFAGIQSKEIGYIETHGTATNLGDPIEIKALTNAFTRTTDKKQFCGIGSVKGNIGHTDAAAGVASFIKTCLVAYHKTIPPSINFEKPNPHINFEDSPFYVNNKLRKWESDKKLIMGVSSFGIGGTNSHVIVEEPPRTCTNKSKSIKKYIIPLSAKTSTALENRKEQLITFIKNNPQINIEDIAFTLWEGRSHMKYRLSAVVQTTNELISDDLRFEKKVSDEKISALAFLFPGQGAQYYKMGSELYKTNKRFHQLVNQGFAIFQKETGINLEKILFDSEDVATSEKELSETSLTQPILFIIEYSLAKLLIENNIIPKYLFGHSIGEYVAACVAGVFDFHSALKIVTKRGKLMQSMKTGKMIATICGRAKLLEIGSSLYEIAAENSPKSCTISFEHENEEDVKKILDSNEIAWIPLKTSHAFHSKAFDPILEEFADYVNGFERNSPEIPLISCLTGTFLTTEQAKSGDYWAKQLRNTVQFYSGISKILENEQVLFIEVGPNAHLSSQLRSIPKFENKKAILLTLDRPNMPDDPYVVERVVGNVWASLDNFIPKLDFLDANSKKILLPTYPFERERYWIDYIPKDDETRGRCKIKPDLSPITNYNTNDDSIISFIIEIWKEYIGVPDIKPVDNFFDLGGTSLLAISISEEIEKKYSISFGLSDFYNTPSVIGISECINNKLQNEPQK